jgi:hypothetical protein
MVLLRCWIRVTSSRNGGSTALVFADDTYPPWRPTRAFAELGYFLWPSEDQTHPRACVTFVRGIDA